MLDGNLFERARKNGIVSAAIGFLIWVRSSFLAFVTTFGTIFFVTGLVISEGVIAGMLVVLGVSTFIYALIGFAGLNLINYN